MKEQGKKETERRKENKREEGDITGEKRRNRRKEEKERYLPESCLPGKGFL